MTTSQNIALIAVTQQGLDQARHLRRRLQTGILYRPARYGPAQHTWERPYETALSAQVAALFAQYDQLIFFLATGAVTRLLAPCLDSKTTDPGVLAIDEAGRFVIPVLSGHTGGANALARTVAGYLGATPVITTASDVIGGLSPDVLEEVACNKARLQALTDAELKPTLDLVHSGAVKSIREVERLVVRAFVDKVVS